MSKNLLKLIIKMSFGIIIYEFILILLAKPLSYITLYSYISLVNGIIIGTILTFALLINIGIVNEDVMNCNNSAYAQKKTILFGILRKIVIIVIIAFFWKSTKVNVLAIVLSIFGLKPGAYFVPIADRCLNFLTRYNKH